MAEILPFFLTQACYACRTSLSPRCIGNYGACGCSGRGSLVDDSQVQTGVAVGRRTGPLTPTEVGDEAGGPFPSSPSLFSRGGMGGRLQHPFPTRSQGGSISHSEMQRQAHEKLKLRLLRFHQLAPDRLEPPYQEDT
jgi:hypothetical protein